MNPYQQRLARVQSAMRKWGADLLFLNYGPGYAEPVRAGMVFTLEPKVWKPGDFHVRNDDMVVVGRDRATTLTKFSHEPNFLS
jgi:Xaa-Pro aminopeptidase